MPPVSRSTSLRASGGAGTSTVRSAAALVCAGVPFCGRGQASAAAHMAPLSASRKANSVRRMGRGEWNGFILITCLVQFAQKWSIIVIGFLKNAKIFLHGPARRNSTLTDI